jgi:hypothetical protein
MIFNRREKAFDFPARRAASMQQKRVPSTKSAAITVLLILGVLAIQLEAQFGGIVSDPVQEAHSWQQLLNDIEKLQRLDATIMKLDAQYNQMQTNARYFTSKGAWQGVGNQIVNNWTTPNSFGETATWNPAVLFGTGAPAAWQNATLALQRNPYLAGSPVGSSRDLSYLAAVETFDGAGPTALQTLGNARMHQTQMAGSIARLQAATMDGSGGMNSEVQQLNLLTAGTVQHLQMQQTTNNVVTSLLEQQTLSNKLQRDALVDHLNFMNQVDRYRVSQGTAWGGAAQSISSYRPK